MRESPRPLSPGAERDRIISLLGFGDYGTQLVPFMHDDLVKLGGGQTLLAVGIVNVERPEFSRWRVASGVRNLSPIPELFEKARVVSQVRDPEESLRNTSRSVCHLLTNELIQTYGAYRAHGAIMLTDDLLHLPALSEELAEMKQHLPQHSLVVNTAIPEPDQYHLEAQRQHIQTALALLHDLKQQGVIDLTILTHLRSPVYTALGKIPHLRLTAKSLASLLVASCQCLCNPTFPQVVSRSSALSPFLGLAAGTAKIATGQKVAEWRVFQKLFGSTAEKGSGDLNDAIVQSKRLTHAVLEEERLLLSFFAVDISQPFYEVYTTPFALTDPRFEEFEDVLSAYLGREYPQGVFLSVSGNGASNGLGGGYYCQTSTFYPVQPRLFAQFGSRDKQLPSGTGGAGEERAPRGKGLPHAKQRG